MEHPYIVLAVFLFTYAAIALQNIPGLRVDRPSGVMIGSTLLLLTGVITLPEAYHFVDGDVMLFLLGMMIMVAYLESAGFFEEVARRLVRASRTSAQFLALIVAGSALLSALFVNDTVCLLVTPIVLRAAAQLKRNPVPYLIAIATASNIGSALTITGNPQNMYIGIQSGIPFLRFAVRMAVPVAAGLVLNYALIRLIFRKEVNGAPLPPVDPLGGTLRRGVTLKALAALGATLALFTAGMAYPLAALVGACAILVVGRVKPQDVFEKVDWTVLLFFAGLFIVTGAFEKAGYVGPLLEWGGPWVRAAALPGAAALATFTALLSNLVSNVPAVILMRSLVTHLGGGERLWMLLAMASTFAGNLTLVGSVANLIVAEKARGEGVEMGFWVYLAVGLPLTLATLVIGTLWLYGV
jgi:Na+/H+ antiporter NhaD/arsenite permease-like protein